MRTTIPGLICAAITWWAIPGQSAEEPMEWPWRLANGVTNNIWTSPGWFYFCGEVLQASGSGRMRVKGLLWSVKGEEPAKVQNALLKNYPFKVADGDAIGSYQYPIRIGYSGIDSYTTVLGAETSVREFDYGVIIPVPATFRAAYADAIKEQQARAEARRAKVAEAKLQSDLSLSSNGVAFAQHALGLRYLTGDGVATNKEQGVLWLEKAAAQGYKDAVEKLKELR